VSDLETIFSADGPLARTIKDFRSRPFQLEMAQAVADTIAGRSVLVAEAGTGTGKTFAYLVPALLSGGKVVISTGTKTLQDQLFDRDIPLVREALNVPVTVALLKGRANYVCHHHLERALADGRLPTREDVGYLGAIERFARLSATGTLVGTVETIPATDVSGAGDFFAYADGDVGWVVGSRLARLCAN